MMASLASLAKKRTVAAAGAESPSMTRNIPRQRGIPVGVHRSQDRNLDLNRNPRPSSLTNFANHDFSKADKEVVAMESSDLDNANAKDRNSVLPKSRLCPSDPVYSIKSPLRTCSPKNASVCDNQIQLCLSASSNDSDVNKPVERGKSFTPTTKPRFNNRKNTESPHGFASHPASYQSPSRIGHAKTLLSNKSHFGRNLNKISSSDETCAVKSTDCGSHNKNSVSAKEISLSADHLMHHKVPGTGLVEDMSSSKTPMGSDLVKKTDSKYNTAHKLTNGTPGLPAAAGKRIVRSRNEVTDGERRPNLRPQSSGPTVVSHRKVCGSASSERSPLRKDSRKLNVTRKLSETFSVESSEGEQGSNRPRKYSGNTGHTESELNERGEKHSRDPVVPNVHLSTVNQTQQVGLEGKFDGIIRNRDLERNSISPSRKCDIRGLRPVAKFSSVPKIQVSRELSAAEVKQVVVPVSSDHRGTDYEASCNSDEPCHSPQMSRDCEMSEKVCDLNGRLFHARSHNATGLSEQRLNMGASNDVVDDDSSTHLEFLNHVEERKDSGNVGDVVLDAETFQQMVEDLKALKSTVLHLQRLLLQTGSLDICDSNAVEVNTSSVKTQHSSEDNQLQKRVIELENLILEQRKIIDGLKQTSAELEIANMLPEIDNATSEAETQEVAFRENCSTIDYVDKPLNHDCSLEIKSSFGIPSLTQHFHTENGIRNVQDLDAGHHFVSSIHTSSENDGNERSCHYIERDILKNSETVCVRDGIGSNSISKNNQLEHDNDGHGQNLFPDAFSAASEKTSVIQSTSGDEEELTVDCSMFDYSCSIDSDLELDFGERPEFSYREQAESDSNTTPVMELSAAAEALWPDEFIYNSVDVVFDEDSIDDDSNPVGIDDDCIVQSSSEFKKISEPDQEVNHNSLSVYPQIHLLSHNVRHKPSPEAVRNQSVPNNNEAYISENSLSAINVPTESSKFSAITPPGKVASNLRSNLRMPKSYGNANSVPVDQRVKSAKNSAFASAPSGDGNVSYSMSDSTNSVPPDSGSLHETTKQLREITASRLPSSRLQKASKLPASVAK